MAAPILSLVPCVAFLVATVVADRFVDYKSIELGEFALTAIALLGFIALPSLLALMAAPAGPMRFLVLVLMTAVATIAGVLVVTTDDAQAGFAVFWVPIVGFPLAAIVWIGYAIAPRRTTSGSQPAAITGAVARMSDRLAALVIDLMIVVVALFIAPTVVGHPGQGVAAVVVGGALGTIILTAGIATRGGTIGQSMVGLAVVDARTVGRIGLSRALIRSIIVVVEVAAAATIVFSLPAIAELIAVAKTGRSLTDRVLRTSVVTTR